MAKLPSFKSLEKESGHALVLCSAALSRGFLEVWQVTDVADITDITATPPHKVANMSRKNKKDFKKDKTRHFSKQKILEFSQNGDDW